jgi:hypothetical protein
VAYVRFASVYRQFQDIDAFMRELDKIKKSNAKPPVKHPSAARSARTKGARKATKASA